MVAAALSVGFIVAEANMKVIVMAHKVFGSILFANLGVIKEELAFVRSPFDEEFCKFEVGFLVVAFVFIARVYGGVSFFSHGPDIDTLPFAVRGMGPAF